MNPRQHPIGRSHYSSCLTALVFLGLAQALSAAEPGVHGRVNGFTEDGKYEGVVAGALIEIKSQGGATVAKTNSGKTGYYRLTLPPGNYYFKVTADGYKEEDEGRGFALQLSEGLAVYNFTLTKGPTDSDSEPPKIPEAPIGQLEGHVYERVTEGVLVGIPQATVALRLGNSPDVMRVISGKGEAAKPEGAGAYRVNLAQGSWKASVVAAGFERLILAEPIDIVAGATTKRDFILQREERPVPSSQGIVGVVHVSGSERTGVAPNDVNLSVIPSENRERVNLGPAANGAFQKDLDVGRYQVIAEAPGYRTANSGPVFVFRGRYTNAELTLYPDTELPSTTHPETQPEPEQLVFNGEVGELLNGTTFRPIAGASARLLKRGQALSNTRPVRTNENGIVRIPVAGQGNFVFLAQQSGYRSGTALVTISEDGPNKARLILEPLGSTDPSPTNPVPESPGSTPPSPGTPEGLVDVTGWVVYESNQSRTGYFGVGRTRMGWTRLSPRPAVTQTGVNETAGSYSVKVPAGTYLVSLQPPAEFEPIRKQIIVAEGMKPEFFVLRRKESPQPTPTPTQPTPSTPNPSTELVTVNGYVVYRSKTSATGLGGIPGARLEWRRIDRLSGSRNVTSLTSGRYDTQLAAGSYNVRVIAPRGYQSTTEKVIVAKGMPAKYFILAPTSTVTPTEPNDPPITFPFPFPTDPPAGAPRTYAVTIRIVESAPPAASTTAPRNVSRPVSGAAVTVRQGLRTVRTGRTGKDGVFSLRLPAGTYSVDVRRSGYVTGRQTVVVLRNSASATITLRKSRTRGNTPTFPLPTFPTPNLNIPKQPESILPTRPK